MQHDKDLKNILAIGSEIASADFTDIIMKNVNKLSCKKVYYQPLISNQIKKIFIATFIFLILLILLIGLLLSSYDLPIFAQVKISIVSLHNWYKIIIFLLSFWLVYAFNSLIEKNSLRISLAGRKKHFW